MSDSQNRTDVAKIRILLKDQPRNRLLFEMILETTATIPEIIKLKVADIKHLNVDDLLPVSLRRGVNASPQFNLEMKRALDKLEATTLLNDDEFLFKSKKGGKPLSKTSVSRLIRQWLESCGLSHHGGVRALRSSSEHRSMEIKNESESQIKGDSPVEGGNASGFFLPKVETRSRQEVVFQELEKAIISGKIPPGQKLVTEKIAQEMGVSRIPVREAMGRLEARGFITTRPKWGSVVNELSRKILKEILELRLLLECEAVAKAAPQVKEQTLFELKEINRAFSKARSANDAEELLKVNRAFHLLAYRDSNAPVLLELINQLWDRVSPYYNIMFRQSLAPHPEVGVNFHNELISAMEKRDEDRARAWIEKDLTRSAEFVLELFDLYQKNGNKTI